MIIIKDIPLVPLQKAVFALIKTGQDKPIYGSVSKKTPLPYMTIGAINFKNTGVKNAVIWNASMQIDIWAGNNDKEVVNSILNDISVLITAKGRELEVEDYAIIDCDVDFVETFPEEFYGYHGVLTSIFKLQKK
ncbi:tail completion protein gp17 [Pectinatus frisingensis]|uniref:tail completion protein gp17 n=1 Tax=Pectinatus frisingensis TaxID=865 RepID=UPI0018C7EA9D|nr:DUF3168 domain-containing protein [Pectinatus frisingensis]